SRLAPDSSAANVSVLLHVPPTVDPTTVRQALDRMATRHAMLRTTFETAADVPVQRVHDHLPPGWMLVESTTWDWTRLRQEAMTAAAMPFDLAQGPLWNARFFHGATQNWLLLVAHHIVVDGWSMLHLVGELKRDCAPGTGQAREAGEETGSPAPYRQFVEWHRILLAGEEGRRLSQYWQGQLAGELPSYDMLYDRPQQTLEPAHYAWRAFHVEAALVERLKALAREEGTTLYVLCLAALQALLYRYTDHEDTMVVTPVFGRSRAQFARTIGDFVNMLVLRDTVRPDCSGRELLAQTKQRFLDALTHQDYPYARLVSDVRPIHHGHRASLAQVLFVLQPFKLLAELDGQQQVLPRSASDVRQPAWASYVIPQQSGQFDLCIEMAESDEGLSGYFEYKDALLSPDRVARMQEHFVRLLEAIAGDPTRSIGSLPLMSEIERRETLSAWGQSSGGTEPDQCLHRLIERQVQRTPDAVAVEQDGLKVTYRDLELRANRLAHYLRRRGVEPGIVVGLCVERSINQIVGLLGILKSGG
ncbi:MAG: AMP-binding protein, partial [Nitrospira sp. CR2.1]|nr:AMP-binding protein [Nitrospira sp. CR2.1]